MPMRPPAANVRTQSARPMPRSIAKHRYAKPMIRAGACGLPASAVRRPPAAMPRRERPTSRVFGVAAGADYIFSPRTVAGFALAGGGTSFSVVNGGTGRSDLFQAGAFVRHAVGSGHISGALAYGWQDITTDRTVTIAGVDHLRAQFNANAFSGRVEGGYRFVTPWMGVTPYAAGQFTTFDLPAYAEQVLSGANTFALAYGARSVTASRSELGVRTDKSFAMQDSILTLRGRAAWLTITITIAISARRSRRCRAHRLSSTAQRRRATPRSPPPRPR